LKVVIYTAKTSLILGKTGEQKTVIENKISKVS
jgi:ribosomal protein S3